MLQISERLPNASTPGASLTLPFELRQKSRLHTRLDSGEEAALLLPRGTVLRHGDCLRADTGLIVLVQAAPEAVSTVYADEPRLFARAAYHLGNRHVVLQVGESWLRYLHDHVLDALVTKLGLRVVLETVPFEPEAGAYHAHERHVLLQPAAYSHGHPR